VVSVHLAVSISARCYGGRLAYFYIVYLGKLLGLSVRWRGAVIDTLFALKLGPFRQVLAIDVADWSELGELLGQNDTFLLK